MAFGGAAAVQQLTDRKVRIGGTLTLAADASGTIGLFGDATADVQLPDAFQPRATQYLGQDVTLAEALNVQVNIQTDVTAPAPLSITKGGDPFQITIHNDLAGGGATSGTLEIIVTFL
jgi:hypothetical protein